jgi:hypothetical protein
MLRKWHRKLFGNGKNTDAKRRLSRRGAALPLRLEVLEDRTLLSNSPVSVVHVSAPGNAPANFGGYSQVPGLAASVTTTAGQTVDASTLLDLYTGANNGPTYGQVALSVDGTVVEQQEITQGLTNAYGNGLVAVPLHWSLSNLSAGTHTVSVLWRTESGNQDTSR